MKNNPKRQRQSVGFDVVNVHSLRWWTDKWGSRAGSGLLSRWFDRTVFRYLVNNADFLRPFTAPDVDRYRAEVALYEQHDSNGRLAEKIANWRAHRLYMFDPPPEMFRDFEEVGHWIEAHRDDPVFCRKLTRTSVPIALRKAKEWSHASTTVEARIAGIEVLHQYPDGFYWAKYVDAETLRVDGAVMQNCLRHGTYEHLLKNPEWGIYGLRDAQHGIHVTIAAARRIIMEAKGKQNTAIDEQYVDMTIDFLNKLGSDRVIDPLLQAAGILHLNGRFGRLTELAEHRPGGEWDFYLIPSGQPDEQRMFVFWQGVRLAEVIIYRDRVAEVRELRMMTSELIEALNVVDVPALHSRLDLPLRRRGSALTDNTIITYRDGRYGTVAQNGLRVQRGDFLFYEFDDILYVDIKGTFVGIEVQEGKVTGIETPQMVPQPHRRLLIDVLNTLDYPMIGHNLPRTLRIIYSKRRKQYGHLESLARFKFVAHHEVYTIEDQIFVYNHNGLTAVLRLKDTSIFDMHFYQLPAMSVLVLNSLGFPPSGCRRMADKMLAAGMRYANGEYFVRSS